MYLRGAVRDWRRELLEEPERTCLLLLLNLLQSQTTDFAYPCQGMAVHGVSSDLLDILQCALWGH